MGGGGGLITLIHHSISYTKIASPINDGITEVIVIEVAIAESTMKIANVYVPPASSCPSNHCASLLSLFAIDAVILGDINGHDKEWSMGAGNVRGALLAGEVESNNFVVLNNPDVATRPSSNSSPDVYFVPVPLALSFDCSISTSLNLDHLPLSLCLSDSTTLRGRKTFINLRKAKWDDFRRETEELFSNLPPPSSSAKGEKEWRRVLQRCSVRHVPAGFFHNYSPGLDAASRRLIAERDGRCRVDPNDPEIDGLNTRVSASITANKCQKWMETINKADRQSNPSYHWRLLKKLSGKRTSVAPNQPISFKDKVLTKPTSIANNFCMQYANVKTFEQDKESRKIFKNMKINNILNPNYAPFSTSDTQRYKGE